jgi:hypothetical protein
MMTALLGMGVNVVTAESIRDAGKPRKTAPVIPPSYDYDWFGPKGSTGNKYKPHQGKKEIARRLQRIKKGGAI